MAVLLGQSGDGELGSNSNATGTAFAQKYTALADGTVEKLWLRNRTAGSPNAGHAALYSNSGTEPGTRLSDDNVHADTLIDGWCSWTLATPVKVTEGSAYWIAFVSPAGDFEFTYYNFAASGGSEKDKSGGTLPASWGSSSGSNANIACCYAEGTEEASPFPKAKATAETAVSTAGTSHAITLPSGIESGDLILILTDKGSTAATFNAKEGWTELVDENLGNGITMWVRDADGTEGTSVTFTSSASTRSASIAYRITGAAKASEQKPELSTVATGTSIEANPGKLVPTGGSKDYLWIAMCGYAGEEADDDTWANTPPAKFTPSPPLQKACGIAGTNLGGKIAAATLGETAAELDPGAFNVDVSAAWRAYTIAVHPAAGEEEPKPVEVVLSASAGISSAAALVSHPGPLTLAASAATSTATLKATAPATLALSASPAQCEAKLGITAPSALTLSATSQSTAALKATAPTQVRLGAIVAISSAALTLARSEPITLSASVASSTAALKATAPALIALSASATSTAGLGITAPTQVVLSESAATATATLALSAEEGVTPADLTLSPSAAASTATLAPSAPTSLPLGASVATSAATLELARAEPVATGTSAAQSSAALTIFTPLALSSAPAGRESLQEGSRCGSVGGEGGEVKIALVKRPPTKKELRESRQFYEALPPLSRRQPQPRR